MLQLETENWLPTFQLKVLQLQYCNLYGTIPNFLLQQHNLNFLDLSHNKLVGYFPTWLLENNTALEVFHLKNNSFTEILQLPNATHDLLRLDISSNNFSGKMPENIGTILPKLTYLDMSKNSFEGNIPSSFGEMKELHLLDLSKNDLLGELSMALVSSCFSLELLDLSNNNLYGQISPNFMNLSQLHWLYLDNNHFSGQIMEGLLNSIELSILDVSNNMLSGHIPSWIGNFSALGVLLMSNNLFEGNIPIQLNNFRGTLDFSKNSLSGSIISFNLLSVEHLFMQKNAFSGSIPNVLLRSPNLMTLDLRDNKFSGRIPYQINEHSELRVLLLRGNYLQGHIPYQLCELKKLGIMDLSHNRLSGSIPSCFTNSLLWTVGNDYLYGFKLGVNWGLDSISTQTYYNSSLDLSIHGRDYRKSIQKVEVEFGTKNRYEFYNGSNLNYVVGLDLSCNELTGEIPLEIGELQKIQVLNLSHNFLSGSIPKSFSNLKMIESLDLSHNTLSGQIPSQLIELNFLSTFNVSYNNFSGPIPNKGQFATFEESSYRGNFGLCDSIINKSCFNVAEVPATISNQEEKEESVVDMASFIWSFATSYVTFILGIFTILWVNSYWCKRWFCFVEVSIDWSYYWLFKVLDFVCGRAKH